VRTHWLTTLFGILLAAGSAILTTNAAKNSTNVQDVAQVVQTIGAVGLGAAAADNRKVNNGKNSAGRSDR
jgi:ABC-type proline/glycine betaine transport system permease subunit